MNLLFMLCLIIGQLSAQAPDQSFKGSFEECKALAKKENKLILIDMHFVGCMPCAEMDKRVLPDPSVQKVIQDNYILYKTDVMKEMDGKKLARKYGAGGFPTYVILNSEGKAILTESGFFGVNRFVPLLQKAMLMNKDHDYLAFDTNLDKDYPAAYSERYIKTGVNHSFSELEPYLAQQQDLFTEVAFLANSVTNFAQYNDWTYDNLPKLIDMYGGNLLMNKTSNLAKVKSKELGSQKDVAELRKLFNYIRPVFNDRIWSVYLPAFVADYYSSSKDARTYLSLMEEYNLYPNWELRSNALGQVILDQKSDKDLLSKILTAYTAQQAKGPLEFSDQYKLILLYTYLGNFEQAERAMESFVKNEFNNPYYKISKDEALAMQAAIKRKDANGFEAKVLKRTLGISMD